MHPIWGYKGTYPLVTQVGSLDMCSLALCCSSDMYLCNQLAMQEQLQRTVPAVVINIS